MSRSFHTKSRNSCGRCKQRRVKCNRQSPVCRNCARRNELCDFQLRIGDLAPEKAVIVAPTAVVWHKENAILDYFSGVVAPSISLADPMIGIWRKEVLKYYRLSPPLYHMVISVSVLHMSNQHMGLDTGLIRVVHQHFVDAVSLFRREITSLGKENSLPVFFFSILLLMVQFATSHVRHGISFGPTEIFEPTDILCSLQKAQKLSCQLVPFLATSSMASIFAETRPPVIGGDVKLAKTIFIVQETLHSLNLTVQHASEKEAIKSLLQWLQTLRSMQPGWRQICIWPASLSPGYIQRLRDKSQISMIVYLCWCLILGRSYKQWMFTTYCRQAIRHVVARINWVWGDFLSQLLTEVE
ncbi:unnamed protein product [Clonostachys byssicola]|uniref:Zn(2)-C6 fungal-type domain-containing protein n=1 Tax=Clonostachys byssicola TaxID=160290 RepID=A0A9N9UK61_9HYPO|nr:unnamed protein product [Clonostachys byssicola]